MVNDRENSTHIGIGTGASFYASCNRCNWLNINGVWFYWQGTMNFCPV